MKSVRPFRAAAVILAAASFTFLPSFAHNNKAPQEKCAVRVDTGLVSLSIAVTDQNGRAAQGLQREEFKVYEDGVEQPISFFSTDPEPVSWGLLLDRSGSMKAMIRGVYLAAVHVIDGGTEQDEMLIATFNTKVETVSDFTPDRLSLRKSVLGLRAGGGTAIWDAIGYGLDHIKAGKHRKKVLIVVTDGEDNSSRLRFAEVTDRAEEEDVLIYTVGMFESGGGNSRELLKLAQVTGGRGHFPRSVRQCREVMMEISSDVSRQYGLGYYPLNLTHDGKWRKVRVVASPEGKSSKYVVRTRAGYYAPKEETIQ